MSLLQNKKSPPAFSPEFDYQSECHCSKTSKRMAAAGRSKPSELRVTQDEAAALVKSHAGKGAARYDKNGKWAQRETCAAGRVVGVYYDMENNPHETQWFRIMYANSNTHIVPVKEPRG